MSRVGSFAGDVDEELAGHTVGHPERVDADLHLPLIEVTTRLRLRQSGDFQGQWQQPQELGYLLLLTINPLVARAHDGSSWSAWSAGSRLRKDGGQDVTGRMMRFSLPRR